ncbi:MAG: hypothetical protein JWQ23_4389 [Herminiimonas sp.]|nr:hypothetical protein [Herminiimonas sp.]
MHSLAHVIDCLIGYLLDVMYSPRMTGHLT